MSDSELATCIESSTTMAKDLHERLVLYKKLSLEPESTQSIPDLDMICVLAKELIERLESKQ
ncbi:MAG: hypothetical protein V3V89_02310 [Gammaproteobacteria bacterium]